MARWPRGVGVVRLHPLVAGEIACVSLRDRAAILEWLLHVPAAVAAERVLGMA